MSDLQPNTAVTPDRKLRIRFDVADTVQAELPFGLIRRHAGIGLGRSADLKDVVRIPTTGWQIKPYSWSLGVLQEAVAAFTNVLRTVADGGTLAAPTHLNSFPMQRAPSEVPGATTGASANYNTGGDPFYRIQLAQGGVLGTAVTYALNAEQGAHPGPDVSPNLKVDRVLSDTLVHDPNEPITVRILSTAGTNAVPDQLGAIFFAGPASYIEDVLKGFGQWCLVLFGDGQCWLFEKCDRIKAGETTDANVWYRHRQDRWTQAQRVSGATHRIYIHPHVYQTKQGDKVGSIWIQTDGGEESSPSTGILSQALPASHDTSSFKHYVRASKPNPIKASKLAVDIRRDQRVALQMAKMRYPETAYIFDDPFSLSQPPKYIHKITIQWFGKVPAGCGISVELHYANDVATDSPLAASGAPVIVPSVGGYASFVPDPDVTNYRVKITLTGDSYSTPTLYEYRIAKDGYQLETAPGEFLGRIWTQFNSTGPDIDPQQETARATIEDPSNLLTTLRARASIHSLIDTEYTGVDWTDPASEGLQSVISGGYMQKATATKKGRKLAKAIGSIVQTLFPSKDWFSYDCDFTSEWTRLGEAQCPYWDFGWDPNAPAAADGSIQPYKATDVLGILLGWAGYPDSMIDIGPGKTFDYTLRLFPKSGEDGGFAVNLGTSVAQIAQRIARDYLGSVLIFDRNTGTGTDPTQWKGMWRLITPRYSPYRNLAYFSTEVPAGGVGPLKVGHTLGAWPDTADPSGSGQMMKGGMILAGSYRSYVIPPEANMVTVSGTGDLSLPNNPELLTVSAINLKSFDFIPGTSSSDPTHPDYLGRVVPLVVVDPNITTFAAAAWFCRRLYDVSCHAKKRITFVGPLVLVQDTSDTKAKRPRPLRYYDPVMVQGQQALIVSVNPFFKKSSKQLAMYEVEFPTAPFQ